LFGEPAPSRAGFGGSPSELRGAIAETGLFFHFRGFQTLAIIKVKKARF